MPTPCSKRRRRFGDLGRYRDMLDATRRALSAARPADAQAYYLQAVLAARAGQYDLARDLMQRATGGAIDDMPGALLLNGVLDYQGGAYEQAIGAWRELVDDQPMNFAARRLLGAALLRSGDADGALDALAPACAARRRRQLHADAGRAGVRGRGTSVIWAARFLDRAGDPLRPSPAPLGSDDPLDDLSAAADAAPGRSGRRARLYSRADRRRPEQRGARPCAGAGERRAGIARRAARAWRYIMDDGPHRRCRDRSISAPPICASTSRRCCG